MNRVWAIKAEQRLSQLEARTKTAQDPPQDWMGALIAAELAKLTARIDALEAKRGPGRPPKDKTE